MFSRTRKRDVTKDMSQPERNPHLRLIKLYPEEQKVYDKIIDDYLDEYGYTDNNGEKKVSGDYILGFIQRKRQVASSVFAFENDEESLIRGIDEFEEYPDAKFDDLLNICSNVFSGGNQKLIVFALFKRTLRYLAIRLEKHGIKAVTISGDIDNRHEVLQEFRDNPSIKVLLSSEVGSEGLDMQFCDSLVNYDLPWNPMVVEQRIGRIDRIGQKSEKINIYNMVIAGSIQEQVYTRLLDRINIFRGTIGDMEAILDSTVELEGRGKKTIQELYEDMEKELYCNYLSKEERDRKIDAIARAIENEKLNLETIEHELSDTMTNDAYFKEEIEKIKKNNSYSTEFEIRNFFEMMLSEALPSCVLKDNGDDSFLLVVHESNTSSLLNFLNQYHPGDEDSEKVFSQFRTRYKNTREFRITFNQQKSYEDKTLTYINIYHIFMQSFLNYFKEKMDVNSKTFRFEMMDSTGRLRNHKVVTIMYEINVDRYIYDRRGNRTLKHDSYMHPVLYDITAETLIEDDEFVATFYGQMQKLGKTSIAGHRLEVTEENVQYIRTKATNYIFERCEEIRGELVVQHENSRMQKERQIRERGEERILKAKENLSEAEIYLDVFRQNNASESEIRNREGAVRLRRNELNREEEDMKSRLEAINADPEIRVSSNLIMINVLSVI